MITFAAIVVAILITAMVARKHFRIWRRTKKVEKAMRNLLANKQPVTVKDVADELTRLDIPFRVEQNTKKESD